MMGNLLISEPPLQVIPSLAVEIGLNEAIVLQQIHYWLLKSNNVRDGRRWVYNSYPNWQKQFPFWSVKTVKRVFTNLEKQGLLISGNYNKAGFDKTKWYTIDYHHLEVVGRRWGQNDPTMGSKLPDGGGQNDPTNTIDYSEITSETTATAPLPPKGGGQAGPDNGFVADLAKAKEAEKAEKREQAKEVIRYLNEKAGKRFKLTLDKSKENLVARLNDGYTVDDCKRVIDNKVAQWKDDPKMDKHLNPTTLFRPSHFDNYLNEQPTKTWEQEEAERYENPFDTGGIW